VQDLERVRAAVVLGLAPILALGLFLGARTVVSDRPVAVTVHPSAIVWSDRVFTNQGQLAVWLQSRDASYRVWVKRHPAASWFHHVFPATPAPAEAVAPTTSSSASDSALLRLLVFGSLGVLGIALTAGALRLAGGALAARRRSTVVAEADAASTARPARPSRAAVAPARRLRTAEIYAPPRVMPALRTRTRTAAAPAARVIPLYSPPEPEPEIAEVAEVVEVPVPRPQPQPTLVEPEAEPEVARLVEQRETLPQPRPSLAEPGPPAATVAPQTADEPGSPPDAGDPVPLPAPPEPEPELEPAAEAAVAPPAVETAPSDTLEDDHAAEEPAPGAMPEPAPPGGDWQTCEIGLWQGYVKSQFYARVTGADGQDYTVAVSPLFRSKDPLAHDEIGRAAHVQLAQQLLEQGWGADGRGSLWYELRFRHVA
jgi:hypothetical protein